MEIKKGRKYLCTQSVVMKSGDIDYVKGKVYQSDIDGCLTDEEGTVKHWWSPSDNPHFYFEPYVGEGLIPVSLTKEQWSFIRSMLGDWRSRCIDLYKTVVGAHNGYIAAGCDEKKYQGFVAKHKQEMDEALLLYKDVCSQLHQL